MTFNTVDTSQKIGKGVGADHSLHEPEPVQVSGKKTVAEGNDYVDHGAACDGKGGGECFLSDAQRGRMIDLFHHRVDAAQLAYTSALEELRVDELMKKDADLSWLVELIFNVVALGAGTAILNAIAALKKTASVIETLRVANAEVQGLAPEELLNHNQPIAVQVTQAFGNLSDATLALVVKQATDIGKTSVHTNIKSGSNETKKSDKEQKIGYLDSLKDQSATVYESIRENSPARLNDVELTALFESYSARHGHTIGEYKKMLSAQIDVYMKSFVGLIGSRAMTPSDGQTMESEHNWNATSQKVKVVWLIVPKQPPKLAYQTYDIGRIADESDEAGFHNGIVPHADHGDGPAGDDIDYHEVEHSLYNVAIARHMQVWGKPPETITRDPKAMKKPKDPHMNDPKQRELHDLPHNEEGK